MTAGVSLTVIFLGAVLALLAAIANKALVMISWHDLEEFCRRRHRESTFDDIHDRSESAVATVESLQVAGTLLVIIAWADRFFSGVPRTGTDILVFVIGVLVTTLALTLWIPREIARYWGSAYLARTWSLWSAADRAFGPLHAISTLIRAVTRRLDGRDVELSEEEALEDEILSIVTEGQHDGLLEDDVREMIAGVIELDDTDVADIMTPRSEMDAIPLRMEWNEMLRFVARVGRTRIPVYDKNLDDVVGVLYVKDLLGVLAHTDDDHALELRDILREVRHVPRTTRLDELLQTFLKTRGHLCMVVDEFMHIVGLVTIEDVLEEIVGEIVDESDEEEISDIRWVSAGVADVQARAHVEEVNDTLGIELPTSAEFDTVGGFILFEFGRIPRKGETLHWKDAKITVEEATRRRIELVRFELHQNPRILTAP